MSTHYGRATQGCWRTHTSKRAASRGLAASLLVCASLLACTSTPAPGHAPQPEAYVARFHPQAPLGDVHEAVRVHFDRAMVDIERVGPTLAEPPVTVTPELPLDVHWEDRATLVIRPRDGWKEGDRYTLRLSASLHPSGKPIEHLVDVLPLRLGWLHHTWRQAPLQPKAVAMFSREIRVADFEAHCALVDPEGARVPLFVQAVEHEDVATNVPFEVRQSLARDTTYAIDCTGLRPAHATAPFHADKDVVSLRTHGLLRAVAGYPSGAPALPAAPERARMCLRFSTDIDPAELAKHVRVTPAPEGLEKSWYVGACDDEGQADLASTVLLAPNRQYRVEVDAELRDVFGQKLGTPFVYSFSTADRLPGVWTATGAMQVLERGRSGHAVGTLNVPAVELRCAALDAARLARAFAPVQSYAFGYDAEYGYEGAPRPPADGFGWLELTPRVHGIDTPAARNVAGRYPIDLGAQCGTRAGAAGLFLLDVAPKPALAAEQRQGHTPARLLANVTDLAVVAKRGEQTALAWVTRLSNAAPVAGAQVRLLDTAGTQLAQTRTDADGLARFAKLPVRSGEQEEFFVVQSGDDVAMLGTHYQWREGLTGWQLGVEESWGDDGKRLFVHTDRGVYRPGERVLVHGLARELRDRSAARVPTQRGVHVKLTTEDNAQVLLEHDLTLSDFGSFHTEIALPGSLPPGSHPMEITAGGTSSMHWIQVADFRPLTFEVLGGPMRDETLTGERAAIAIETRYLFGAVLPSAQLKWTVERSDGRVHAPEHSEYRFEDSAPRLASEAEWPGDEGGVVLSQDATGDAQGKATLAFDTSALRGPQRYAITVEAVDQGQDRVSRSFGVLTHSAERYVGVRMGSWLVEAGEPVDAELVVVDRAGKLATGDVEVELRSVRWDCRDPSVQCTSEVKLVSAQRVTVTADAPAHARFVLPAELSGEVHVRATVRDGKGRQARASDQAWVRSHADGSAGEDAPYRDGIAVPLSVDKRTYAVGDRARLALQTTDAPLRYLVTVERADVLDAKISRAASESYVDLATGTAPNAFVTMTGMLPRTKDGLAGKPRLVAGAKELQVQGKSRVLAAEITMERAQYEPGQRVQGRVRVTHLGKPLSAEVSLVVVNESVLQLTGFSTPDPTRVFHAQRKLGVSTVSNVPKVIADPAREADVPDVAQLIEENGTDGNGGRPDVRDDYVAAAFWAPDLRTDARGEVSFAFDAPSDTSSYRVMVVAAAKDDRVGSGQAQMKVRMPLAVRPVTPRFASRGDALDLGALLHDHTGAAGDVDVRFSSAGLVLARSQSQVPSAGEGAVLTSVMATVGEVDAASFEVEAHKGAHADRVKRELHVRRPLDTELRVLASARSSKVGAELRWPGGVDPELSELQVTVDRAGLAPLAPLLASVMRYPFGCTEQTLAALSALVATPELARAVLPELATEQAVRKRIEDGHVLVLRARGYDGLFGLYPGLQGRPWLSALVLDYALAARDAGHDVPAVMLDATREALRQWVKSFSLRAADDATLGATAHVAALLSRAGSPELSLEDELWTLRDTLDDEAHARLLHAWAARKEQPERRAQIEARLAKRAWLGKQRALDRPLASAESQTGVILHALVANAAPSSEALRAELANWLIARALEPEVWFSTRDVASTLTGLGAWARTLQGGSSQIAIGAGDEVWLERTLHGAEVVSLTRTFKELAERARRVSQKQSATPGVWVKASTEVTATLRRKDVRVSAPRPAFSRGLSLKRRYLELASGKPIERVKPGDLVQVVLELSTEKPMPMVAVTDPLPAGLEPLDPGLSSGSVAGCESCDQASWGFDYVRKRDDRIEAFAEYLGRGTHTMRYVLRATIAGSFSAPGAEALPMYAPNLFGRSEVTRVEVKR